MTNKLTRTIGLATAFAALAFTHPAFAQDFGETVSAAMDAIREARDRNAAPENVKAIFAKASEAEEDGCLNFCGFYLGMPVEDARLLVAHYGLKNDEWGGRTVNGAKLVYRFEFSLKGVRRITKGGNSFDELSQAVANRIGTMKPKRNDDYDLVGYEYKNIDGQTALISEKDGLVLEDGNLARKAAAERAAAERIAAAERAEAERRAAAERAKAIQKAGAELDENRQKARAERQKVQLAAEQGDAQAQYKLANYLSNGYGGEMDKVKALEWTIKSAEQGYAASQSILANYYYIGGMIEKDYHKAAEWYRKVAEQDIKDASNAVIIAKAQLKLASMYRNGYGVEKNKDEATKWNVKAVELWRTVAEGGEANAQWRYGQLLEYGDGESGIEVDKAKAVEWYAKAAEQGHASAMFSLGKCYAMGVGIGKDERKAVEWYTKAAEQGNVSAMSSLGDCYRWGRGVGKDELSAAEWYAKAAAQGDVFAMSKLGECYANGRGVGKDEQMAAEWYQRYADWHRERAEQGESFSMEILGDCYARGKGVEKSKEKATQWYRKAVNMGRLSAQRGIDRLQNEK